MHPADIKAALEKAGLSQTAVAAATARNVTKGAVCRVINGTMKSQQIAQAVALAIGKPVGVVFPGKYPALEFIEAAGLSQRNTAVTQAEADLTKLAAARKPAKKTAARRATA